MAHFRPYSLYLIVLHTSILPLNPPTSCALFIQFPSKLSNRCWHPTIVGPRARPHGEKTMGGNYSLYDRNEMDSPLKFLLNLNHSKVFFSFLWDTFRREMKRCLCWGNKSIPKAKQMLSALVTIGWGLNECTQRTFFSRFFNTRIFPFFLLVFFQFQEEKANVYRHTQKCLMEAWGSMLMRSDLYIYIYVFEFWKETGRFPTGYLAFTYIYIYWWFFLGAFVYYSFLVGSTGCDLLTPPVETAGVAQHAKDWTKQHPSLSFSLSLSFFYCYDFHLFPPFSSSLCASISFTTTCSSMERKGGGIFLTPLSSLCETLFVRISTGDRL